MSIEERAHLRQIRQEQKVDKIDVQRSATNILQRDSYGRKLREILLIESEIHQRDGQKAKS